MYVYIYVCIGSPSSPTLRAMRSLLLPFLLSTAAVHGEGAVIAKTITVDKLGHGDFTNVQDAISSVPDGNNQWIKINIKGTYREKVVIPKKKGFVYLQGEGNAVTSIEWGDYFQPSDVGLRASATFWSQADNVVVKAITFKNTYNGGSNPVKRAVAVYVDGDKVAFHDCNFEGFQDTLADWQGRHYFARSRVEGSVDFIYGIGQSIYENCTLHVSNRLQTGYITAQGRQSSDASDGFMFKSCTITGSSKTYLGRAWNAYSRVIFYDTYMPDIVVPEGWDSWLQRGREQSIVFAEFACKGPGSSTSERVAWERKLSKQAGGDVYQLEVHRRRAMATSTAMNHHPVDAVEAMIFDWSNFIVCKF